MCCAPRDSQGGVVVVFLNLMTYKQQERNDQELTHFMGDRDGESGKYSSCPWACRDLQNEDERIDKMERRQ